MHHNAVQVKDIFDKKQKKRRIILLEDGDSVRHLNTDSSIDCHEHDLVYGLWAPEHLKRKPGELTLHRVLLCYVVYQSIIIVVYFSITIYRFIILLRIPFHVSRRGYPSN